VTRPALLRAAACLLAATAVTLGTVGVPGSHQAAGAAEVRTPLRVTLETLSPAVLPRSGRVTLTGQVTNRSKDTWTDLKAYLFTSGTPMATGAEVDEAAATSEDAAVGNRLTSEGQYDVLGDLAPGESTSYRVSLPRDELEVVGQPGVYWIGVHVLGAPDGEGRDKVADGRVRTFIPVVPRVTPPTRLSLVVPLKAQVRRGAAGRLLRIAGWQRSLSGDGRLGRLLGLSGRATAPITWVVDPAVIDAARSVAQDNPILDTGPDGGGDTSGSPSPTASTTPSEDPSGSTSEGSAADPSPEAVAARAWLDELRRQAPTHTVMTVPYGDLDVAAALRSARTRNVYQRGGRLSTAALGELGVENAFPVINPVSGRLPASALRRIDAGTPVLLADAALPDAETPVVTRAGRAPVVLTDTSAGSGGPAANERYGALAMRQRLLAATALHALSPEADQPLVVSTPPYWDPGGGWSQSDFFAGLAQPWLRMVDLPAVVSAGGPSASGPGQDTARRPTYRRSDRRAEVPLRNLVSTERLARTGQTYGGLLSANDTVEGVLARIGMLASSQAVRDDPDTAREQVDSTTDYIRSQIQQVRVEGPDFVMMSGGDGPIQVTLVNGLDQPVRVGITARTRSRDLRISEVEPVTLGPGSRRSVQLDVRSSEIGVHAVTLLTTDANGDPVGGLTQFSVRTSRVSTVIWVIMAAGGALLFIAIVVRLIRRVRRRKATHGPRLPRDPSGDDPSGDDPSGHGGSSGPSSTGLPGQELNA
jgi:hypothetical protein